MVRSAGLYLFISVGAEKSLQSIPLADIMGSPDAYLVLLWDGSFMIIGTGIDIVEIARFRKILKGAGERFLVRVFTREEQRFCLKRKDSAPHFAVRFAAKEAVFKALETGWAKGVTWLDVEVLRQEMGAPSVLLHGATQEIAALKGVERVHLSLTHTDNWAAATAILEKI